MKNLILPILLLFASYPMQAQDHSDTIRILKNQNTQASKFYLKDQLLKPKDMVRMTQNIPEANAEALLARQSHTVAVVLGFTGGFILGWQVGQVISQNPAPWSITILGLGALVVSIPYNKGYHKHATNAAQIYNLDLQKSVGMERAILDFGITSSGMGFQLTY